MLLISCSKEMTAEQIQENNGSGIVLVRNRYYYKVQLAGKHTFWFVPEADAMKDIQFYTNEDKVRKQAVTVYGTGFFVSKDGIIVSHSQIVNPSINTNNVCQALANQLLYLKQYYSTDLELYNRRLLLVQDAFQTLNEERHEAIAGLGGNLKLRVALEQEYSNRKNKLNAMLTEFQQKRDSLSNVLKELEHFNNSEVTVSPVLQLQVAYYNTVTKNFSDWQSCSLQASNATSGLAVIALDSKLTPETCHIFDISSDAGFVSSFFRSKEDDNHLFIVGLKKNHSDLSNFELTVFPERAVSGSDNLRLMYAGTAVENYNIGSPVLNKYGEVVAVNATGASVNGENCYGIKIKNLFQLVKIKYN